MAVGGAALWIGSNEASADHRLSDGCTDKTGGDVIVSIGGFVAQFNPNCVIVNNQQQITWDNGDVAEHNPGDGHENTREFSECFQTAIDSDTNLLPGDTYSVELRFDTSTNTLFLEKAWYNGDRLDLNGADDGFGTRECPDSVWEWNDDAHTQIAIDYICHIHPSTMHGQIQMNV